MKGKDYLRVIFSSDPNRYYRVSLFDREGFERRKCESCGKFFWTLDGTRRTCPDQPCQPYTFLGDPPTKLRLGYVDAWKLVEDFFVVNAHASVKRYPVVCRWRPDLFFTVASIVDFQRVEGNRVVFQFPENPLVVPQICLRFNDIANVGISGRHYTSFCMIGQHSLADGRGYWKDRCIELDYELLTDAMKIPKEEITFVEDVWLGYGAFGYSLEYFVRGLELGNAVFTQFEGDPEDYNEMSGKVIDMGAGLERFSWISLGTPTSYESTFGGVFKWMSDLCNVEYDADLAQKYYRLAGSMSFEGPSDLDGFRNVAAQKLRMPVGKLASKIGPIEAMFAILDHSRTLTFAIGDGGIPGNVGGGYNLRVILRRALSVMDRFGWSVGLDEIASQHARLLKPMYPELLEHQDEITTILGVETRRYRSMRQRTTKILEGLRSSERELGGDDLLRLYESEGIPPEALVESGVKVDIPADLYSRITERHMVQKQQEEKTVYDFEGLPDTRLLFYEDQGLMEFDAMVLRLFSDGSVALDQTAFYPRSGGQEPDHGKIEGLDVVDVEKHGGVVVHRMNGTGLREGIKVKCVLDSERRGILMRHHSATHVLNGAARRVLGSWIWQHSAYKDLNKARLDITHYAHLTKEELRKIETLANRIVQMNLPVDKPFLPRSEAERRYGFYLYQGGAAPGERVRVVDMGGWDVEACGGTHVDRTGDIGVIKILKSERVQDGIERIEFVAGEVAVKHLQGQEDDLSSIAQAMGTSMENVVESVNRLKIEFEKLEKSQAAIAKRLATMDAQQVPARAIEIAGVKVYSTSQGGLDDEFHIMVGERAIELEPRLVYCALSVKNEKVRVVTFCGSQAREKGLSAGELAREVASMLGGSGGGDKRFGQGGGTDLAAVEAAANSASDLVASHILKA